MASIASPHFFTVPLDHQHPDEEATLTLFARTLCRKDKLDDDLPWLLYLQGARALALLARPPMAAGSSGPCRSFGCCCSISAAPATPPPSVLTPWRG
jgi:hypothetical protein